MRFETIKNNKKKYIISGIVVLIGVALILTTSLAKYKATDKIAITEGNINYIIPDMNVVAIYQENDNGLYESVTSIPTSGYIFNSSESKCYVNPNEPLSNVSITFDGANINITGINQKGTKCYVYFNKISYDHKTVDDIVANSNKGTGTPDFSKTSCSSDCEESTVGLYEQTTSLGTTYYYRGDASDNYVVFANHYWRIIRINESGSLRLIYQGRLKDESGNVVAIGDYSDINALSGSILQGYGENLTGYMYGPGGISYSSSAKIKLEEWYAENLIDYNEHMDNNSGFCGDRSYSTTDWYCFDSHYTHDECVAAGREWVWARLFNIVQRLSDNSPTYECLQTNDLNTINNNSNIGNEKLIYPIGLITADEVIFAGGSSSKSNEKFYLYFPGTSLTMTPHDEAHTTADLASAYVLDNGILNSSLNRANSSAKGSLVPVINLNVGNLSITGSGTIIDSYIIEKY